MVYLKIYPLIHSLYSSAKIIRRITSRCEIGGTSNMHGRKKRNAYKILMEKSEGKRPKFT
jgi:hypothetical protein